MDQKPNVEQIGEGVDLSFYQTIFFFFGGGGGFLTRSQVISKKRSTRTPKGMAFGGV